MPEDRGMGQAKKHARQLDADFLTQPAGEVAAVLIRAQQAVFRRAWAHYLEAADDDPEALHDLRVELRRLRVWLRLSRDVVRTRKSTRRRLKALARASSPMRDHEVMLELLDRVARDADGADVAARIRRLADERQPAGVDLAFDVKPGLKPRARKGTTPFDRWFASQVAMMTEQIERDLSSGRSGFHAARIQVKHLRYLIEPMHEPFAVVDSMLADLKTVQDWLGDLHDLVVFRAHLADYAGWLLTDALPAPLARPGKQARPLSQTFAGVRDDIIRLSAWQDAQFEAMWRDWETRRPALEKRLYAARNRLVGELDKAAGAAD
ncbi:CHAD domain-containing protein [Guyparkeria halophila]|uniref:CHAD domain-containing protein n=1 Tax=Guyparkeria halophila TaxID=47960 RepID=A0ABZ0YZQ4_9GAMM|nr:CHAD domain-containing protein [Guyparkeria halophila]WQH16819.1 CHAD domain-containing protein [Guyparkeria halophila]